MRPSFLGPMKIFAPQYKCNLKSIHVSHMEGIEVVNRTTRDEIHSQ